MRRIQTTVLPLLGLLLCAAGCPHEQKKAAVADDPVSIVREYLRTSVTGDLSSLKDLVQKRCHNKGVGRVEATVMLGSRVKLDKVQVQLEHRQGDTAAVRYKVTGSIEAIDISKLKGPATEVNILGQRVEARPPTSTVKGMSRKGSLDLVRDGGRWKLTCKN